MTTPDGELIEDQITIFVYSLDLEIYLPQIDGGAAVAEADEESVGSQTFNNIDNDDKDAIPDLNDNEVTGGDNELVKLRAKITFYPDILPAFQTPMNDRGAYNVNFALHLNPIAGADNIKLWKWDYKKDKSDFIINKADLFGGGSVFFVDRYLEGIKGNDLTRGTKIRLELENQNTVFSPTCGADVVALTVVEILAVKWLGMGNGALSDEAGTKSPDFTGDYLDADTEYGATNSVRVFPDGRIEGGVVSASKNKVRIKIEMTPTAALPTKLYLRAFDMDDPSQNKKDTGMINRPEGGRLILDPNDDGISGTYEGGGGQTYDLHNDNRGLVNTRKYGYVNGMDSKGIFKVNISSKDVTINDFIVSEFAGDNYALFAASDSTHLLNFENKDSSDLDKIYDTSKGRTLPIDKGVKSNILTVWRLLHIEYDAMKDFTWSEKSTGNLGYSGKMISITPNITPFPPGTNFNSNTVFEFITNVPFGYFSDSIYNDFTAVLPNGRFSDGRLFVGTNNIANPPTNLEITPNPIFINDVYSILSPPAAPNSILPVPLPVTISLAGQPDLISNILSFEENSTTHNVTWRLNTNVPNAYIGGKVSISGNITNITPDPLVLGNTIIETAPIAPNLSTDIPVVLRDDDKQGLLPGIKKSNLDTTILSYKNSYIQPYFDGGGDSTYNQKDLVFTPNINSNYENLPNTSQKWIHINSLNNYYLGKRNSAKFKANNFWTVNLLNAYQSNFENDSDPNNEMRTIHGIGLPISDPLAVTHQNIAKGVQMSAVFLETIRDDRKPVQLIISHEIGHQFGLSHGAEINGAADIPEYSLRNYVGLMHKGSVKGFLLIPRHKNLIRSRVTSPGKL